MDLKLLAQESLAERVRGCMALSQSGSAAFGPLLERAVYDNAPEVREAAVWAFLCAADHLSANCVSEQWSFDQLLHRGEKSPDAFVRLGIAAAKSRSEGGNAAREAEKCLGRFYSGREEAALCLLERLVREDPERDPDLQETLERARHHRNAIIRERAGKLTGLLSLRVKALDEEASDGMVFSGSLRARRKAVASAAANQEAAAALLLAVKADPDRTVRHLAAAKLYLYLREGGSLPFDDDLELPDRETLWLFVMREGQLEAAPDAILSLISAFESRKAEAKQRVLLLAGALRQFATCDSAPEVDALIRRAMRDKDREVRRRATLVARAAANDGLLDELTGRLRERVKSYPPYIFWASVGLRFAVLLGVCFTPYRQWAMVCFMGLAFVEAVVLERLDRHGTHGMRSSEYLETLQALEPIAARNPERLRESVPELQSLSRRSSHVPSEVRAKARELLARIHESELHQLPIAATEATADSAALPIPDVAPEQREVARL